MKNKIFILILLILLITIIGFLLIILNESKTKILSQENKIFELQVELDNQKEIVYQQKLQLNSYE